MSSNSNGSGLVWLFVIVFAMAGAGSLAAGQGGGEKHDPTPSKHRSYSSCDEVRKAGVTLRRGDPGYVPYLDKDLDGKACEPGEG